jgi:hypothetical protein
MKGQTNFLRSRGDAVVAVAALVFLYVPISSVPTFFRGERAVEARNPKLNLSRVA